MGKVNRLCNRIEPFAALFWLSPMYILANALTLPAGLVSPYRRTQSMSLYGQAACMVVVS